MKGLRVCAGMALLLFVVAGCSSNGVEGVVERYGDKKPLNEVSVQGSTETNIKEQMSKARVVGKTGLDGRFSLSGLIARNLYRIEVQDTKYLSGSTVTQLPEKGTVMLQKSIAACPLPPDGGIWFYSFEQDAFSQIKCDPASKIAIEVQPGLIGGKISAFLVPEGVIGKVCAVISRDGLLVSRGGSIKDVGQLHLVHGKTVSLGKNGSVTVQGGWYYNVADFYSEDFALVDFKVLKPRMEAPQLDGAFESEPYQVWAVNLRRFVPGMYLLVTDIAKGQRADKVLGGETHPKAGFLVKIQ